MIILTSDLPLPVAEGAAPAFRRYYVTDEGHLNRNRSKAVEFDDLGEADDFAQEFDCGGAEARDARTETRV